MEPKINAESKNPPVLPGESPISELELWDPPFERWMKIADAWLGTVPLTRPAVDRDSKTPPVKH